MSVCDSVRNILEVTPAELGNDVIRWRRWRKLDELRHAIGLAAKNKGWFKRPDLGQELGQIVCRYLDSIPTTELALTVKALRTWVEE